MATFVILRHPVTSLVTDFTNPENWTNDLLILNFLSYHSIFTVFKSLILTILIILQLLFTGYLDRLSDAWHCISRQAIGCSTYTHIFMIMTNFIDLTDALITHAYFQYEL